MGIVTSVNHTLSHEVARLRVLMKSLLTEVKKHVVSKILPFWLLWSYTHTFSFQSVYLFAVDFDKVHLPLVAI